MIKFRKSDDCYYISSTTKNDWEFINWVIFYWGWTFDISYEICGYFDNRPRINLSLFFFRLTFVLPFRNKWTDECDPPQWGVAVHNNTFWIYKGGAGNFKGNKWWAWELPFVTREWVRTSILLLDNTWEHETNKSPKDFYGEEWSDKKRKWTYLYKDGFDNSIIPAIVYVQEMEWRPKWLKWTKRFATIRRKIDVHFSKEVGSGKESWKGGTIGCTYEMLPNEHPLVCLKRMESERKF